jgi:phospho-N-acetylmuramoyl-pentapeptide-transferase
MSSIFEISRILIVVVISFSIAFFSTPLLTYFLYKYRLGKQIRHSEASPIFESMHKGKAGTPTMGGILIWGSTILTVLLFWLLDVLWGGGFFRSMNFLTRQQTLLPLGSLLFGAIIGLADDFLGILKVGPHGGGLGVRQKLGLYAIVSLVGAWWFYFKLGWDYINVPFLGNFHIGWWYIPIFILVITATAFSSNEADGLDGLAGGVLAIAFGAYGIIAYLHGMGDLAALCAAIVGGILAFLWFNIYPARFFMGDTGSMALGITLGVIAMLTNAMIVLPFIAFILVLESGSVILQVASKKLRHKKLFLSTPIHHHFEAKGWPETKVTMRFWIIAAVFAMLGLIIELLGFSIHLL